MRYVNAISAIILGAYVAYGPAYGSNLAHADPPTTFLRNQLKIQPSGHVAIASYRNTNDLYAYDQALAVISFTLIQDNKNAQSLLKNLQAYYVANKKLPFNLNQPESAMIAGSIAWVSLAANTYSIKFKTTEFEKFSLSLLTHLQESSTDDFAVKFSSTQNIISIEHQIDTLAAIESLPLKHQAKFQALRGGIIRTLQNHWVGYRFLAGSSLDTKTTNKTEVYVDTQAWGYMALATHEDFKNLKLDEGLKFNCGRFLRKNPLGFPESNHRLQNEQPNFIWSEGTLGMIAAMQWYKKTTGTSLDCQGVYYSDLIKSLTTLEKSDGGMPYATLSIPDYFTDQPSVAATAWMQFVRMNYNPFKP